MVPSSSWEIKPDDIVIAKHSDGSDWEIGSGGFGKASFEAWNAYGKPQEGLGLTIAIPDQENKPDIVHSHAGTPIVCTL